MRHRPLPCLLISLRPYREPVQLLSPPMNSGFGEGKKHCRDGRPRSLPASCSGEGDAALPSSPRSTPLPAEPQHCHLPHWTPVRYNHSYFQLLGLSQTLPSGVSFLGMQAILQSSSVSRVHPLLASGRPATGREASQRGILSDLWFPGKDSKQ